MKSLDLRTLGDTLANLRDPAAQLPAGADRLSDFDFAPNPGNLRARCYLPPTLRPGAPLVVALHGCVQNAAAYDHGAGWSQLADRLGFALLFPEQRRVNNPTLCFNWFLPEDMARDQGELASIRAMVDIMVRSHGLDASRIFATGLSAGGAVTGTLLAHYPEVFAGGAIVAGAPFGVAKAPPQAFSVMRAKNLPDPAGLQAILAAATPHTGPWPRLSIWQGDADRTVAPANAEAIVAQWRGAHALAAEPDRLETLDGARRRVWLGAQGKAVVEVWNIPGMGHGAPLALGRPDALGAAMPFMFDVGIASTEHIARFFGLDVTAGARDLPDSDASAPPQKPATRRAPRPPQTPPPVPEQRFGLLQRLLRRLGLRR